MAIQYPLLKQKLIKLAELTKTRTKPLVALDYRINISTRKKEYIGYLVSSVSDNYIVIYKGSKPVEPIKLSSITGVLFVSTDVENKIEQAIASEQHLPSLAPGRGAATAGDFISDGGKIKLPDKIISSRDKYFFKAAQLFNSIIDIAADMSDLEQIANQANLKDLLYKWREDDEQNFYDIIKDYRAEYPDFIKLIDNALDVAADVGVKSAILTTLPTAGEFMPQRHLTPAKALQEIITLIEYKRPPGFIANKSAIKNALNNFTEEEDKIFDQELIRLNKRDPNLVKAIDKVVNAARYPEQAGSGHETDIGTKLPPLGKR